MKTFMCDICTVCVTNPFRNVKMQEITIKGKKGKRIKKHLCEDCFKKIVFSSTEKRSDRE